MFLFSYAVFPHSLKRHVVDTNKRKAVRVASFPHRNLLNMKHSTERPPAPLMTLRLVALTDDICIPVICTCRHKLLHCKYKEMYIKVQL